MLLAAVVQAPHASAATVETEVFISEQTPGRGLLGWSRVETTAHRLAVPPPVRWTLDTVRGVLSTLRRYLPPHDAAEAIATVEIYSRRRAKCAAKTVILGVRARGWEAQAVIPSLRVASMPSADGIGPTARTFTEPMLAALKELEHRSPLAFARIAPVALDQTPIEASVCEMPGFNDLRALFSRLPNERRGAVLKALHTIMAGLEAEQRDCDD